MILQTITLPFDQSTGDTIYAKQGETGRGIMFHLPFKLAVEEVGDYKAEFIAVKPDDTFVIQQMQLFGSDEANARAYVLLDEQVSAAKGFGGYILKIYNFIDDSEVIYSAAGGLMVDDALLTDSLIESVAEANGYVFPDDFLTRGDLDEIINDNVTAMDSTWSSQKILDEIEGHVPEPPEPVSRTATGNPITLTDAADAPMVKCVTQITGSQDLHGYDKPWVGGAGKNKLPMTVDVIKAANTKGTWSGNTYTYNNVTFNVLTDSDGNVIGIKVNGTNTESLNADFYVIGTATSTATILPSVGDYILNGGDANARLRITDVKSGGVDCLSNADVSFSATQTEGKALIRVVPSAVVDNVTVYPMIRLATVSDATFEPYSNICPITAYTEGEIEVSDGDGNTTTHTTNYPSAIYRGSEDAVNGEVTTEWGMIASYAGETLPGEWISDRDEYAPGTTPTTGAQVAYELATPTTSSVTPTNLPIRTLSGYNHIESTTGDMDIEYITAVYDPIMEAVSLEKTPTFEFSTDEHIVGKWIDGRPIYEKTLMLPVTAGSRLSYTYPEPIADIDGLVMWSGGFSSYSDPDTPSDTIWGQGAWNDYSWGSSISLVSINSVEYQFGTSWGSDVKLMLHLFYTKTTDL